MSININILFVSFRVISHESRCLSELIDDCQSLLFAIKDRLDSCERSMLSKLHDIDLDLAYASIETHRQVSIKYRLPFNRSRATHVNSVVNFYHYHIFS